MVVSVRHCEECGEKMPPYSRVCPYCLYDRYFDNECRCHISPVPYLKIMQSYLDEALTLSNPDLLGGRDEAVELELVESFEMVESILECSFGDNGDVVEAISQMSELLDDAIERRRTTARRRRIISIALFVALSAILLFVILS